MPFSMNIKNLFSAPEPSVSEKSSEAGAVRMGELWGKRPDPNTVFIDKLLKRATSDREATELQDLFGRPKSTNALSDLVLGKQAPNLNALTTYATLQRAKAYADNYGGSENKETGVYKFNPLTGETELVEYVPKGSIVRNQMSLSDYGLKNEFANGRKLYEDFQNQPASAEYQKVVPAVQAAEDLARSARENPNQNMLAIDQGIITLFNKALDPASVVRESEYLRSTMDAPLFNRWQAAITRISQGGRLSQPDREAIVTGLKVIAERRGQAYNQMYDQYAKMAEKAGADPAIYLGQRHMGFDIATPATEDADPIVRTGTDQATGKRVGLTASGKQVDL